MKVKLITPDSSDYILLIKKIYTACRTCYSELGSIELFNTPQDIDKMIKLIDSVIDRGHHSTLEHVNFTFCIDEVSRTLTHQLVRFRISSFSQQSQRYCTFSDGRLKYGTPSTIQKHNMLEKYNDKINECKELYDEMVSIGIPAEDARFILPNATYSNIVMTMNFRELIHAMSLRLCTKAQWEIRQLFMDMRRELIEHYPYFGNKLHPKCITQGKCTELNSCEYLNKYNNNNTTKE